MTIEVLRVDGSRETREIVKHRAISEIEHPIAAPLALDTVNLRDGRVMLVDDTGMIDGRPVNAEATRLYHGVRRTPHSIHGDVVIARDKDFA